MVIATKSPSGRGPIQFPIFLRIFAIQLALEGAGAEGGI